MEEILMTKEEISKLTEEQIEVAIAEAIHNIAEDNRYAGKVFHASSVYFTVTGDEICEISDDASCSPKGGWFPDIVTGPSSEKKAFLEQLFDEYSINESFFYDILECFDEVFGITSDEILEYFAEDEDGTALEVAKELIARLENGSFCFS